MFFGVQNLDDAATGLTANELVKPLADRMARTKPTGPSRPGSMPRRKRHAWPNCSGPETPTLLFTASHGMGFPTRPAPASNQGALLCGDWPGPDMAEADPEGSLFCRRRYRDDARLLGLLSFHFACYGAGTPQKTISPAGVSPRSAIAPKAFVARLPQRLLGHPKGGALATIGHVERAWGYSFQVGPGQRADGGLREHAQALMEGHPVGSAVEYFNERYAELEC